MSGSAGGASCSPPLGLEDKGGETKVVRAPRAALTMADFEIEKVLGSGSFAQVMQGKLLSTGVSYALKIMDKRHIVKEGKAEYVLRERRVLDALKDEGLVNLCFTFQDPNSLYLGCELCTNGELFDQIQERGKFPIEDVTFYAAEIVLILAFLHRKGVVHRDLKPENLLLTDTGHLKLGDFGSVKLLQDVEMIVAGQDYDAEGEPERKTSFVGTAEYASPEVLSGGMASPAMDWWAFGCLLYQMIVGKPPFRGGSQYLTFQKIEAMDYTIPGVGIMPLEAADLIKKLLVKDPKERLGSGPGGVEEIKGHAFFEGIKWDKVREMDAPKYVEVTRDSDNEDNTADFLEIQPAASNVTRVRNATSDFLWSGNDHQEEGGDNMWSSILQPDETIVKMGNVRKYKGMFYRTRILVLTDRARLLYVDPDKMELKGEIELSSSLEVVAKNDHSFSVKTKDKQYVMDTQGASDSASWVRNITEMQNFINS